MLSLASDAQLQTCTWSCGSPTNYQQIILSFILQRCQYGTSIGYSVGFCGWNRRKWWRAILKENLTIKALFCQFFCTKYSYHNYHRLKQADCSRTNKWRKVGFLILERRISCISWWSIAHHEPGMDMEQPQIPNSYCSCFCHYTTQ